MNQIDSVVEWTQIDAWYDSLLAATPAFNNRQQILNGGFNSNAWHGMEEWWRCDSELQIQDIEPNSDQWACFEPWWESYLTAQHEALSSVKSIFTEVQQQWEQSSSRFDNGPLSAEWTGNDPMEGPLWTRQEENWSQWLAHLIRTAPSSFTEDLFGVEYRIRPRFVEREQLLTHGDMINRFPDILVQYPKSGVSIEVKKGDKAYKKTIDTAELIEIHYPKDWSHLLLLPMRKKSVLRDTFDNAFADTEERPVIRTDRANDIHIVYWEDVSRIIRRVLQNEHEVDAHWEASAYVFATLIEEKIAKFVPQPAIEKATRTEDVVPGSTGFLLTGSDIEAQLAYLRRTLEDDFDE